MKLAVQYWWVAALQGLFLIAVGALAIFNPRVFIQELVQYLGLIFFTFGGIMTAAGSIMRGRTRRWWQFMMIGLIEAGLGLVILASPSTSSELFTLLIGAFALLIGLIQLGLGLARGSNRLFNLMNALLFLSFGALIIWNPFEGLEALSYLVAFFSVVLGLMIVYYSIQLRRWGAARKGSSPKAQSPTSESDPTEKSADQGDS